MGFAWLMVGRPRYDRPGAKVVTVKERRDALCTVLAALGWGALP